MEKKLRRILEKRFKSSLIHQLANKSRKDDSNTTDNIYGAFWMQALLPNKSENY